MAGVTLTEVSKIYDDGTRAVSDLNLDVQDGELVVFVGPSGCGKSTALRMIAGLEEISEGEIKIGERIVNNLRPRDRDVAMVFQNYALYPHMTVAENIGFALRMHKVPKDEARRRIEETAKILGLSEHLRRKPRQLSGGQRQRVAMGRAIMREPHVFLMDEPLSNLDAKLRVQMRAEISRIQRQLSVTTVYVTHDQVEAMTMGDRVAVLRRGLLQQFDAPQLLYEKPANLFVASFIGSPAMNVLEGTLERDGDGLAVRIGATTLAAAGRGAERAAGAREQPRQADRRRHPPGSARRARPPQRRGGRPAARPRHGDRGARPRTARVRRHRGPAGPRRGRARGTRRHGGAEDIAEIKSDADGAARANVVARLDASATRASRRHARALGRPSPPAFLRSRQRRSDRA